MSQAAANNAAQTPLEPDGIRVRRWFAIVGVCFVGGVGLLLWLGSGYDWQTDRWAGEGIAIGQRWETLLDVFREAPATVKLLGFGLYISLCNTFLPLPTGGVVSAVAMRDVSVAGGLWGTVLLVAGGGAAGSTIANLNDYHIFTLLLRHHRIGQVRETRLYDRATKWFHTAPFWILVIFNIIPIPVDVIRMLATTSRYPRSTFALANFLGRFVRYGLIAAVTYLLGEQGWVASVGLLALAVVLGVGKLLVGMVKRRLVPPPATAALLEEASEGD